ncbi:ubiquinol-cytochrome c reductase subunit 7 [Atractiella rhizophila]|nr:ubiquinol-cytochrome c reductase subunit 7 [Atractiella rhizophila]
MPSVLSPSFASSLKRFPRLFEWGTKASQRYMDLAGWRKYGLKMDDLITEENPVVQKALTRLEPREQYDRAFRLRRAIHYSMLHEPLPKEQWTTEEQDTAYLRPHIVEIEAEIKERQYWDDFMPPKKGAH